MKIPGKTLILCLFAAVFLGLGAYRIHPSVFSSNSVFSITSPIPNVLSKAFPEVLGEAYLWQPDTAVQTSSSVNKPNLASKSVISYDLTSGKTLYAENIRERLPMASLTKIMTAIVVLENQKINTELTVSKDAIVGENTMGLSVGEKLTVEDLLYGLILPSGNDAAETLAAGSKFERDNFVYYMNKKAEDLGLSDTHFTNPTGLEGDGRQYTTAYDLLVMTKYALEKKTFEEIVGTYEYVIEADSDNKEYHLYNDTNLLTSYPGVRGVKTGFTFEAGMCLVTYLEYKDHKIIAVLLNSENRRQEMKDLLDYSLLLLGTEPPPHS